MPSIASLSVHCFSATAESERSSREAGLESAEGVGAAQAGQPGVKNKSFLSTLRRQVPRGMRTSPKEHTAAMQMDWLQQKKPASFEIVAAQEPAAEMIHHFLQGPVSIRWINDEARGIGEGIEMILATITHIEKTTQSTTKFSDKQCIHLNKLFNSFMKEVNDYLLISRHPSAEGSGNGKEAAHKRQKQIDALHKHIEKTDIDDRLETVLIKGIDIYHRRMEASPEFEEKQRYYQHLGHYVEDCTQHLLSLLQSSIVFPVKSRETICNLLVAMTEKMLKEPDPDDERARQAIEQSVKAEKPEKDRHIVAPTAEELARDYEKNQKFEQGLRSIGGFNPKYEQHETAPLKLNDVEIAKRSMELSHMALESRISAMFQWKAQAVVWKMRGDAGENVSQDHIINWAGLFSDPNRKTALRQAMAAHFLGNAPELGLEDYKAQTRKIRPVFNAFFAEEMPQIDISTANDIFKTFYHRFKSFLVDGKRTASDNTPMTQHLQSFREDLQKCFIEKPVLSQDQFSSLFENFKNQFGAYFIANRSLVSPEEFDEHFANFEKIETEQAREILESFNAIHEAS